MSAYSTAVLADSPAIYWRLGDASGTTATDSSGNSRNGTYVNAPTLGATGALTASGDTDTAATFASASSQYVTIAAPGIDLGDVFSIEFWIKRTETGTTYKEIFNRGGSNQIEVGLWTGGKIFCFGGGGQWASSSAAITDTTTWHHVVVTKSGATRHVYIDNVDVTTLGSNFTCPSSTSAIYIGATGGSSQFVNGSIDEVAIYTTALSAARVSAHYTTATSAGSAPSNTVAPAVTGTSTVGSTLTTDNGTWSNSPTGYTYQWQRDNTGGGVYSNIVSATAATYTLTDADDGCNIRCVVTATNASGSASANSNSVGTVTEPAPANSVAPVASGTATVGQVLSTTNGTWSNMGGLNPTYTYQWQRDVSGNLVFSNIASATSSSYTLVDADDGNKIRCVVTAHNTNASTGTANSNALGTVVEPVAANSVAPVASGNANVNSGVSATTGTWTHMGGTAATFAYQWQDSADGSTGWANIVGATLSGYAIASGELNKYLRCNVTATNTGGTSAATSSNVLGPVGAALPVTYRPLLAIHPGRFLRQKGLR